MRTSRCFSKGVLSDPCCEVNPFGAATSVIAAALVIAWMMPIFAFESYVTFLGPGSPKTSQRYNGWDAYNCLDGRTVE